MAQGGRISGTAVAAATAGGVLIYAALRDVTPLQALRDVLSGKPAGITSTAGTKIAPLVQSGVAAAIAGTQAQQQATAAGGHGEIASAARKYVGVPYVWGGASPSGFDCSGLVTWVLHHDLGLNLPSNTHTVTGQFLIWSGAVTVSGPPVAGDLVCWAGHIAIASGNGKMIEAPGVGKPVRETALRTGGAVIRRVIIASTAAGAPNTKQPGTAF